MTPTIDCQLVSTCLVTSIETLKAVVAEQFAALSRDLEENLDESLNKCTPVGELLSTLLALEISTANFEIGKHALKESKKTMQQCGGLALLYESLREHS